MPEETTQTPEAPVEETPVETAEVEETPVAEEAPPVVEPHDIVEEEPAINQISMHVPAGSSVALVGRSGSLVTPRHSIA